MREILAGINRSPFFIPGQNNGFGLVGVYMMQSVKHLLWYATTFKTQVVHAVVE